MPTGKEEKAQPSGSKQARYAIIQEDYRRKILNGELQAGEKVESELEIQKRYGVSRITARQAIQGLENDGLVKRYRGRGTFVTDCILPKPVPEALEHLSAELVRRGQDPEVRLISLQSEQLPEKLIKIFGLETGLNAICMRRLYRVNGAPIAYTVTWTHSDKLMNLNSVEKMTRIYQIMELASRVIEEFTAIIPSQAVREILDIDEVQPVLCRSRILYDEMDRAYVYTETYARGDQYSYIRNMKM